MGTGKAKAHSKQKHKQLAKLKKRSNNARIIAAHRHNVEKDDTPEATTETGRSKHMAKVIEKQRIKQMLNYKKAERLNIKKKSTDGGEKTQRRALCEEIKLLKVTKLQGGFHDYPIFRRLVPLLTCHLNFVHCCKIDRNKWLELRHKRVAVKLLLLRLLTWTPILSELRARLGYELPREFITVVGFPASLRLTKSTFNRHSTSRASDFYVYYRCAPHKSSSRLSCSLLIVSAHIMVVAFEMPLILSSRKSSVFDICTSNVYAAPSISVV